MKIPFLSLVTIGLAAVGVAQPTIRSSNGILNATGRTAPCFDGS